MNSSQKILTGKLFVVALLAASASPAHAQGANGGPPPGAVPPINTFSQQSIIPNNVNANSNNTPGLPGSTSFPGLPGSTSIQGIPGSTSLVGIPGLSGSAQNSGLTVTQSGTLPTGALQLQSVSPNPTQVITPAASGLTATFATTPGATTGVLGTTTGSLGVNSATTTTSATAPGVGITRTGSTPVTTGTAP